MDTEGPVYPVHPSQAQGNEFNWILKSLLSWCKETEEVWMKGCIGLTAHKARLSSPPSASPSYWVLLPCRCFSPIGPPCWPHKRPLCRVHFSCRMHPTDPTKPCIPQSPGGATHSCHHLPGRAARVRRGGKTPTPLIEGLQQAFVTSTVQHERKSSHPPIWKEKHMECINAGTRDPQLEGDTGCSYLADACRVLPSSLLLSPVAICSVLSRVFLGFCSLSVCL